MPKKKQPSQPTKAFVDGDLALYPAACTAQTTWYVYVDETGKEIARFDSAAKGAAWIEEQQVFGFDVQHNYQGDCSLLTRTVEIEQGDLETAKKNFESIIKRWVRRSGVEDFEVYVAGSGNVPNFRMNVAIRKKYKGNRDNVAKPVHFNALREWVLTLPYVKRTASGFETDDQVCAKAQKLGQKGLLIQSEKDGLQCVGCWVFHPDLHDKPVFSDPSTVGWIEKKGNKIVGLGWLFLLKQIILGDTCDFYSGLDGAGIKQSMTTLAPFNNQPIAELGNAVKAVCELYMTKYGNEYELVDKDGNKRTVSWYDLFEETVRLAYMLKSKKDRPDIILDIARKMI